MKKDIKVTIEGKDYSLKYHHFRSQFFLQKFVKDNKLNIEVNSEYNMLWLYCHLYTINDDFRYEYEEFIDLMDNNVEAFDKAFEFWNSKN